MEKREKCICFAYYGNGKFLGWYSDTFGTITANSPKIYGYSEKQLNVIRTNFSAKVKRSRDGSDDFCSSVAKAIAPLNEAASSVMTIRSLSEKAKLEEYGDVVLKVVECPFYNGPNPDFDKEKHEERLEKEKEFGIYNHPYGSKEREELIERFIDIYGEDQQWWISSDYQAVKEWAANEPTEFLETIKPDLDGTSNEKKCES